MIKNEKIVIDLIKSRPETPEDLARAKRYLSKKYKIPLPANISLLKSYHELIKKKAAKTNSRLEFLLRTRPIRSLSGIVNISVLTKPYPCPGKCLYCPTEPGIPKSYVSGEPAVERAKALKYDPYSQVKRRIEMLEAEGHPTDKIELRIVGGTWSFYPQAYREWFIKKCFDACNGKNSKNLAFAQKMNEKTKHRIIGLSVETRPDFINKEEVGHLREIGVTMIELGVQSIYDDVLKKNLRGHGKKEIISATKLLKDAGFKVLYQMMPNLLGSDLKRDKKMFEELFKNPNFQPDMLKIYPCALLREAPLCKLYKDGKYKPYSEKEMINLIRTIKKKLPLYVRVQRIARDIPSKRIIAGAARISNLRQLLSEDMKKSGWACRCIRCREVKDEYSQKEKIYLFRKNYKASGGKEIFLSFENKNRGKLYALLRLRITPVGEAIIRELHTFGQQLPIVRSETSNISPQHQGLGKKLVKEAEKIALAESKKRKSSSRRIAVISGIGVRNYFRKLGYKTKDTYMAKSLDA